ncbi:MAG: HesA/MoeB/ThiF family protein [Acetatifactor sp.]|nr:HesA/MoeB/ThiF family protein [Acetatifactor sp.]
MKTRYAPNVPALSRGECESLAEKSVCVIGCGGLGGYVTELLARVGVGRLTLVDPDVFKESNLNRQLFATEHNLGMRKVEVAAERISTVNSSVAVRKIPESLSEENAARLLTGHDVAVDALDNIPTRLLLAKHCRNLSIPLVHGAIGGWYGQVSTILPGDNTLELLYQGDWEETDGPGSGSLSFSAAATAAIECGEVLKLLTEKGEVLSKRLLVLDMLENQNTIIDLH